MSDRDEIQIRSFSVVFALDRRLHRIDRWRVPLPYGLPLRSLGYGVGALAAVLIAGRLPILGAVIHALPAPMRLALLPCAIAYVLTSVRIDGRPAHEAAAALLRWKLQPSTVTCWQRGVRPGRSIRLADVTVAPDCAGSALRRGTVTGPAAAVLRYPTTTRERARTLVLEQASDDPLDVGFEVAFDARHRLVIR